MGFMRISFSFMSGTLFGAYVAQNYNIPNLKKRADYGYTMAKRVEENYRKPAKEEGNGDDKK